MRPRPFWNLPWTQVVAMALAAPLLGIAGAQANPIGASSADAIENISAIVIPSEPQPNLPMPIEWIGQRFLWSQEPILLGEQLLEQEPVGFANPGEEVAQQRGHVEITRVEVSDLPDQAGRVATLTGFLPTPCHELGWEVPKTASADGLLRIQAWSITTQTICVQSLEPFSVQIPLGTTPFDRVMVNEVMQSNGGPANRSASPADIQYFFRGSPGGGITATPGPLPVAAALAGWHCARRLRRRSQPK